MNNNAQTGLNESLVARTLKRGFPFLRFDGSLEQEFREAHHEAWRPRVRVSTLLALLTVSGFAVMDHWLLGKGTQRVPDLVRFFVHLPIVLLCLVGTSQRFYRRYFVPGIQIAAPLFGLGSVIMAMQLSDTLLALATARLVLVTFFFYFMTGMSFHAALRSNLVVFFGLAVTAAVTGASPELTIYQLFVLLCANLYAGAGSYALEHANRLAFLERRLLTEVAMHDGLTGLLNRAAFEDQVRRVWDQGLRERASVAVIMIDIDHFKPYNDRYGHQAGDQCLRLVAQAVRRAAKRRPFDFVARYGGEELIAVLYGADRAYAEIAARSILDEVAELAIPHAGSTTKPWVTVSVGAAACEPARDVTYDAAIRLADQALYAAKELGRARCVVFDPASTETLGTLEEVAPILRNAS